MPNKTTSLKMVLRTRSLPSLLAIGAILVLSQAARSAAEEAALLISCNLSSYQEAARGLRKGFKQDLAEYVFCGSEEDRKMLVQFVRARAPKVLIAVGTKAAAEARAVFPDIPLVYCMVVDPERQGLANKKKLYGVSFTIEESVLLSRYKTALPHIKKVGLVIDEGKSKDWVRAISENAKKMEMELVVERVGSSSGIPAAMRALSGKIDAFWMTTDPVVTNKFAFKTISDFSLASKIPLLVPVASLVGEGGLLSVTASAEAMGAEAALLAKDVLAGQPAESLLVQPSHVETTLSLAAAEKIGVRFPDSIMSASKQVP